MFGNGMIGIKLQSRAKDLYSTKHPSRLNVLWTVQHNISYKDQQDSLFTCGFIPINNLYMFRLITRKYYSVCAAIGICHDEINKIV
jgi:hypothetical protein